MEQTSKPSESQHFFRMMIVTLFVVLLGTILYAALRKQFFPASQQTTTKAEPVVTPFVLDPAKPWLSFSEASNRKQFAVGEQVTLTVNAFSKGKSIEGYDILFTHDPKRYEILSIESVNPSFEIYKFEKTNHLSVTGLKNLSDTNETVLNNTPLLKVVIRPMAKGELPITFVSTVNKEQTKFTFQGSVSDKDPDATAASKATETTVVYTFKPQLQPLMVEIN